MSEGRERRRLWGVWEMFVALTVLTALVAAAQWMLISARASSVSATVVLEGQSQAVINATFALEIKRLEQDAEQNKSDHRTAGFLLVTNLLAACGTMAVYIWMNLRPPARRRS